MEPIKVMSFNIRVLNDKDGINCMKNREERVRAMLAKEDPDIIGFQEICGSVWDWLDATLSDRYTVVGCGRNADYAYEEEGTPIAFRRSRFRLIRMDTFWLSDTPEVPGSRLHGVHQSPCPRMAISLLLHDKTDGSLVTFINTHTDHTGAEVRCAELLQIADYMHGKPGCKILTGDMNATPDSREITEFLARVSPMHITDCTASVGGTFHGYGHENPYWKIDYIFTDLAATECFAVPDPHEDGIYYSDHLAICATLIKNNR